jgi:hypothetical protein
MERALLLCIWVQNHGKKNRAHLVEENMLNCVGSRSSRVVKSLLKLEDLLWWFFLCNTVKVYLGRTYLSGVGLRS